MKFQSYFLFLIFWFVSSSVVAQNLSYAKECVDKLTSQEFAGRGYVNNGDKIAANFISEEFKKHNLLSFEKNYFQELSFPINTINHIEGLSIDGKELKAGTEFLINAASISLEGSFPIIYFPDSIFDNKDLVRKFYEQDLSNSFILFEGGRYKEFNNPKIKGIIVLHKKKLVWSASQTTFKNKYTIIETFDSLVSKQSKTIKLNYTNKFIKKHKTQNVIGYIKGKSNSDSCFVFTAHYDHLGMMGEKCYFPGANDNASGTAMIMDLASYYSKPENQPEYTIVFMAFCGEEAGLLGSSFAAEHPYFNLKKIKFLLNLDMVGTGSAGIQVVNATKFPTAFALLDTINKQHNYLAAVNSRGEACNSDHCPFYNKGVPAFFIFTLGGEHTEYHNVYDVASHLPFTEYNDFFLLITNFIKLY